MKWFIPSWNGDYRLEPVDDGKQCRLIVHDPTPEEQRVVKLFLEVARQRGWTKCKVVPKDIVLTVGLTEAAPILVQLACPSDSTLTAVRFKGGEVEVDTGPAGALKVAEKIDTAEAQPEPEKKPEAAVTVKRPTPCCPSCVPGAIEPAREVLLSFLTPEQHEDWSKHRWIEVVGGTTGHRYVIAHRHSRFAQGWTRNTYDRDDGFVVHYHDWSVPPEEEVLAAKLILEHREAWLRNEATCAHAYGTATEVLKNPFGGVNDGVADAALTATLGMYGQALLKEFVGDQ